MISSHLPVLQVIVPMIAAPLCVLLRRDKYAWALATLVTWAILAMVSLLLIQVINEGEVIYHLGGWPPPYGIEYRLDALNTYVLLMISAIAAVVTPFAAKSVAREIEPHRRHLFYAVYLLTLTGLLGIVASGDAFNVYVFLEIASLGSYVLIGLGPKRQALKAAYKYLIQGTIGATFILIGIGLLYMMTGTLNMADLAERIGPVADTRPVIVAFAILTVGILIKLALFPLHLWLPGAYTHAPSTVSAFLAATSTKVGAYLLLRFVFTVFGADFAFGKMPLMEILMPLSLIAIVAGSAAAIGQKDAKRLLAFSSVGQIGYLALGVSFATVTGLTGGIVHIFNHGLTKGGMFLALGCVAYRLGNTRIESLHGLGRRMPLTSAALVLGGLGLIGVPGTAGFISKWYLVQAAIEGDLWPVAVIVLLGSLIALVYVGRLVEAAYFHAPNPTVGQVQEAPASMLIPTWILIIGSIYFGFHTELTVGVAETAALTLMGSAP